MENGYSLFSYYYYHSSAPHSIVRSFHCSVLFDVCVCVLCVCTNVSTIIPRFYYSRVLVVCLWLPFYVQRFNNNTRKRAVRVPWIDSHVHFASSISRRSLARQKLCGEKKLRTRKAPTITIGIVYRLRWCWLSRVPHSVQAPLPGIEWEHSFFSISNFIMCVCVCVAPSALAVVYHFYFCIVCVCVSLAGGCRSRSYYYYYCSPKHYLSGVDADGYN